MSAITEVAIYTATDASIFMLVGMLVGIALGYSLFSGPGPRT